MARVRLTKKGIILILSLLFIVVGGATGFIWWRIQQESTLGPTGSSAGTASVPCDDDQVEEAVYGQNCTNPDGSDTGCDKEIRKCRNADGTYDYKESACDHNCGEAAPPPPPPPAGSAPAMCDDGSAGTIFGQDCGQADGCDKEVRDCGNGDFKYGTCVHNCGGTSGGKTAGQACTIAADGKSDCGAGLVCTTNADGSQTCNDASLQDGGGQCTAAEGSCGRFLAFKCSGSGWSECFENRRDDFSSYADAVAYVGGCGQVDVVCSSADKLCGGFQIFRSSCDTDNPCPDGNCGGTPKACGESCSSDNDCQDPLHCTNGKCDDGSQCVSPLPKPLSGLAYCMDTTTNTKVYKSGIPIRFFQNSQVRVIATTGANGAWSASMTPAEWTNPLASIRPDGGTQFPNASNGAHISTGCIDSNLEGISFNADGSINEVGGCGDPAQAYYTASRDAIPATGINFNLGNCDTPVNQPPVCRGMTLTGGTTVGANRVVQESTAITVKNIGYDPDGRPAQIGICYAIDGKDAAYYRNGNNFVCSTGTNLQQESNGYSYTLSGLTFASMRTALQAKGLSATEINNAGIVFASNTFDNSENLFCSSNPGFNNGAGIMGPLLTQNCTATSCLGRVRLQQNPNWSIDKNSVMTCIDEATNDRAKIEYTITVRNTGAGNGTLTKVEDTMDSKVQPSFLKTPTIVPTGTVSGSKITWALSGTAGTFTPGQEKTYKYTIEIPVANFGQYVNNAAAISGTSTSEATVSHSVAVNCNFPPPPPPPPPPACGTTCATPGTQSTCPSGMTCVAGKDGGVCRAAACPTSENCSCGTLPTTGIFDSTASKIVAAFILISVGIGYMYSESLNGFLVSRVSLAFDNGERVQRTRRLFEKRVTED